MQRSARSRLFDLARLGLGSALVVAIFSLGHLPLGLDLIRSTSPAWLIPLAAAGLLAASGLAPLFAHEGLAALEFDLVRAVLGGGVAAGLVAAFHLPMGASMFASAPAPVVIAFGAAVLLGLSGLLPMLGTLLRPRKRSATGEEFVAQRLRAQPGIDLSWGQPVALAEYHVESLRPMLDAPVRPARWFAEGPMPPPSAGDWPQHRPNESPWGPKRPERF